MSKARKVSAAKQAAELQEVTAKATAAAKRLLEISIATKAYEVEKTTLEKAIEQYHTLTGSKIINDYYRISKRRNPVTLQVTDDALNRDSQQEQLLNALMPQFIEKSINIKAIEAQLPTDNTLKELLEKYKLQPVRSASYSVRVY
ncbi:MAG: hypothetical protein RLZZ292_879 [Bacteroidota bacterium]|jgi:hypothetical protein